VAFLRCRVFVFGFIPLLPLRKPPRERDRETDGGEKREEKSQRERKKRNGRAVRSEIEIIARDEEVFLVKITVSRLAIFHAAKYRGDGKGMYERGRLSVHGQAGARARIF